MQNWSAGVSVGDITKTRQCQVVNVFMYLNILINNEGLHARNKTENRNITKNNTKPWDSMET